MPQTITTTSHGQTIAGAFTDRDNADQAVKAFEEMGISPMDIQVIVQLTDQQTRDVYTSILSDRGFASSQAAYYDEIIRKGKVLVAVFDVTNSAEAIDIFDKFGAEYNPSGSRDVRQDVLGMTTGAVLGATALGVVGAVMAGPVGAVAGVAAGAAVGGGAGAIAGIAAEHNK
jgi:hypothetical protein